MTNKYKQQGFTLIELMIVLAILGVLSSIAVPSYMSYVTKSKRTEAKTEMLRIAQLQESYYIQNLSYAKQLSGAGGLGFTGVWHATESELYNIRTQGLPRGCNGTSSRPCSGFMIVGKPDGKKGQAKDKQCTEYYFDNTGKKGAKGSGGAGSFSASVIKECWN